ncbi:MAG: hypothetical protein OZSIB_3086 [Candidatus Ozemobacter sibiricus]|uniref:Uncharacterized protein n=1 Tax=Candidatus Ozemobacter sibiricus TaxID=2268124 RepID=A0A367ZGR2_9BACT|nr:MAG: hypothetical protein OZSIB_3086 [Candidatus Ozemobacter sibiricus]
MITAWSIFPATPVLPKAPQPPGGARPPSVPRRHAPRASPPAGVLRLLFRWPLFLSFFLRLAVVPPPPAFSCTLAEHAWEPALSVTIPLAAPLILTAEVDRFASEGLASATSGLHLLAPTPDARPWLAFLLGRLLHPAWPLRLLDPAGSLLATARTLQMPRPAPLLLRLDQIRFRFVLYRDRNSRGNCFLLVLAQEARTRAILPATDLPWASEFPSLTWVSCTFHLVPLPGHIIALTVFPVHGHPLGLFENPTLVENLLARECLAPRRVIPQVPQSDDIPPLPDPTP